jgi:hypothetical protein
MRHNNNIIASNTSTTVGFGAFDIECWKVAGKLPYPIRAWACGFATIGVTTC